MAWIRHFIKVPQLPYEVRDQFKGVEVVKYLTPEKGSVKPGSPILRAKTWWAVVDIVSTVDAMIAKNLYDDPVVRGCQVGIDEIVSLAYSDADDLVGRGPGPYYELRVVEILKEKPKKKGAEQGG